MFVAVIFCIFGVACAQHMHPHGCCVDREFEVVMGEVGGSIVTEHGIPTPKLHQGFNILHYDYYSRKMAVESHLRQDDGTLKLAHVLYDFFNDKTYIMSTGSCNVTTIPPSTHFREPCILPDAKFLGETYMGYGVSKVPLMNWEMKTLTNHNLTVRVAVTKEGCTPIIEAIYGYADRSGNEFDLVYVFNNYHPGIRRRDVFNVPHICNQGHQKDIPESANRIVRKIINLYT